jgi:hypothetical protein
MNLWRAYANKQMEMEGQWKNQQLENRANQAELSSNLGKSGIRGGRSQFFSEGMKTGMATQKADIYRTGQQSQADMINQIAQQRGGWAEGLQDTLLAHVGAEGGLDPDSNLSGVGAAQEYIDWIGEMVEAEISGTDHSDSGYVNSGIDWNESLYPGFTPQTGGFMASTLWEQSMPGEAMAGWMVGEPDFLGQIGGTQWSQDNEMWAPTMPIYGMGASSGFNDYSDWAQNDYYDADWWSSGND